VSETLEEIKDLVAESDIRISDHGYDELAADDIAVEDILAGVDTAILVEDYPEFAKGPCVLVLEFDAADRPIHVVWGIPRGRSRPAVVVTAYRPDPARWSDDFLERRSD
jgi:hypothetical protein